MKVACYSTCRIFQDCILQAIRDSIAYFHLSNERLSGVSLEYEAIVGLAPTPGAADHAGNYP
jgi:hypothetical protein